MTEHVHRIGTHPAQPRALFADIVASEGGGFGPSPLNMRGGGWLPDTAEGVKAG